MAYATNMGEPLGDDFDDDFASSSGKGKKVAIGAVAAVALLALFATASYSLMPGFFDATFGPLLGIKAAVDPKAVVLYEEALALMRDDTDAAYDSAQQSLEAALAIDPQYPQAIALFGLSKIFRGNDLQAEGKVTLERGNKAVEHFKALSALRPRRRPRDYREQLMALQEEATTSGAESKKLFERGGKFIAAGLAALKQGNREYPESVELLLALGLYYATDPDGVSNARKLLDRSLAARPEGKQSFEPDSPPDIWSGLLQGRILAAGENPAAVESFRGALGMEPGFHRARFRLAELLSKLGRADAATHKVTEILDKSPTHKKALALQQRLAAAAEDAAAADDGEGEDAGAISREPKKRRQKRRRVRGKRKGHRGGGKAKRGRGSRRRGRR